MSRLVMKFGGTSVGDIERIRNVARHVKREVEAGHEVAVVVSAMACTTNQLVTWCQQTAAAHDAREYDAVGRPASRSPPGCWRSPCRISASRRAHGKAGSCRFGPQTPM